MTIHLCDGAGKDVMFITLNQLRMVAEEATIPNLFKVQGMAIMGRESLSIGVKRVQDFW